MKELDTQELVEEKLEEMGIKQLVLLENPIIVQLKTYRMIQVYMVFVRDGYLSYFDGANFKKINISRILTISE
ncbi:MULTISPECIES: hypothetical protein [unclassified Staphylococcus]|uniref:hypothetical protein n=1 Tax=unclassified Staphylococcus TaxID=91994 RepID=UPI001AEC6542|nr:MULTISPECIES: hypothetical protein [unclassified Staphylococcus]